MDNFFNSKNIIDILLKWKWHLAVIVVVTVIVSAFISSPLVITPLYKSYAVVYPSNISPYSDENETEQMVQMLQSRDIRDSVVLKFNLARHWKLDSSYEYFMSSLDYIFSQRVKITKTPYEAVSIQVWDPDPRMACDVVNALLEYYNTKVRSLHKEKFKEVVRNYEDIVAYKKRSLDSLAGRAKELGLNYGLMDYEGQTREVMRAILGNGRLSEAQKYRKALEEKGGEMKLIEEMMTSESEGYTTFKLDYDRAMLDYNRNYTFVNTLTRPYPADKKDYPIRWLIVVGSLMAVLFLSVMIIGTIEKGRVVRALPGNDA
jgi:capsular polysaccharide biosynthesis protein